MAEYHVPVMLNEVLDALAVKENGIYLDGTLGGGGHSSAILSRGGKLIALDRDDDALAEARARFERNGYDGYTIVKSNFKDAGRVLDELKIDKIDGALLDLGISSHQIDEPSRGFSYRFDGALDMRMGRDESLTAYDVVNEYSESELADILYTYAEEKFSRKIASAIVTARKKSPISSTLELADIIKKATPEFYHRQGHPAKKTFQAIRIEVNGELEGLAEAANTLAERLKSGGRLAIITFHSLEDRIIKQAFKLLCTDCICDKSIPICVCGHKALAKNIGKLKPSKQELGENSRSASATLRVIEKL
ncbi:MAG: 16S rRNA (cytosine(1402)-N(4))-methyltransferase RsmH [Clostridia bacterium]|nr:16S rRNA (cytosine(1402)-N(4))-methyltransferase RsmH [Clostridia bacterium]